MKIAFLINQTHKEEANFTTTVLALEAHKMGHEIYYIGLSDFVYHDESNIEAHVRNLPPGRKDYTLKSLLEALRNSNKSILPMADIDVLWLRFDPTLDMYNRPWAAAMGIQFAQLIKRMGRLVINDPDSLSYANNKLYLENFPKHIRPQTLVTRDYTDVVNFITKRKEKVILKPLKGSGGLNVFMIGPQEHHNLKQTVEVIARDGYIIAQEYLHDAVKGDIRFFLLDGYPIIVNSKYAAVNRVQKSGEIRSNIHQGASTEAATITPMILDLVSCVSEKLKKDNMYFVGLDIVGDKIMEINVFSPGALKSTNEITGVNFAEIIIKDLEDKVNSFYNLSNNIE